jgi:hypothetical protein
MINAFKTEKKTIFSFLFFMSFFFLILCIIEKYLNKKNEYSKLESETSLFYIKFPFVIY